ncbi:MAG: hypothetical protein U9R72_16305 [Chloroflexota bacterium]|nr:hypothetical protein [Chloroflexota bacterium]
MEYHLADDRMAEAEVSLRLAFHLLGLQRSQNPVRVAIDGAQIRVHGSQVFPIQPFLQHHGWEQVGQKGKNPWQGWYEKGDAELRVHSRAGEGDVVTWVRGRRVRAECKSGPLIKKPGSKEYPKLRKALGQVLTVEQVEPDDVLVVAVPLSDKFRQLANKWRMAPLVRRCGIWIVLVGRDGTVEGLDLN